MNERFLARGKLKYDNSPYKKGDWVYGNYVELKDGDRTIHCIYGYGEIIPETLGGYTCLTDKNSQKVFEGDIVNCSCGCPHEVIYIKEHGGTFFGGMPAFYLSGLNEGYAWTGSEEIIGNIHDNPELLKEVAQNGG